VLERRRLPGIFVVHAVASPEPAAENELQKPCQWKKSKGNKRLGWNAGAA
jgi:hypothetical protein